MSRGYVKIPTLFASFSQKSFKKGLTNKKKSNIIPIKHIGFVEKAYEVCYETDIQRIPMSKPADFLTDESKNKTITL